jgi:hypothetical protein
LSRPATRSSHAVHLIKGVEDGTHAKPAVPDNALLLGYVNIPHTATSLNSGSYSDGPPALYDALEWAQVLSGENLVIPCDNSAHKVQGFDPIEDPFGMWDDANNQFVIPTGMDGVYFIEASVRVQSGPAGADTPFNLSYLRNGVERFVMAGDHLNIAGSESMTSKGSHTARLTAGDTLTLWVQMERGSSIPNDTDHQVKFAPLSGSHSWTITRRGR